ncbi:MAG: hypothetical protein CMB56_002695 [Methanobacteriota archaeon]|nr:MAG: hypothetical protein CMB56_002695 [Euryarchaeota archaeon]
MKTRQAMSDELGLAIIMPAHNEAQMVKNTIHSLPAIVDLVIFINDGSTDSTQILAEEAFIETERIELTNCNNNKSFVIINQKNLGVGSAVFSGMEFLLNLEKADLLNSKFSQREKWIIIIMDADGQMNPGEINKLISPIKNKSIDHVKGKRIGLKGMPKSRKIGSFLLTILMRFASGYNKINDPQCGYRAIDFEMIKKWDFKNKWNGFGYTNWWLLESGRRGFKLDEVEIESIYNESKSKLKIHVFLPKVSILIFKKLWKRGVDWYVLGRGGTNYLTRFMMSFLWFTSIFSIVTFLVTSYHFGTLFYSILGLTLCKFIDNHEIEKRSKLNFSPLIN